MLKNVNVNSNLNHNSIPNPNPNHNHNFNINTNINQNININTGPMVKATQDNTSNIAPNNNPIVKTNVNTINNNTNQKSQKNQNQNQDQDHDTGNTLLTKSVISQIEKFSTNDNYIPKKVNKSLILPAIKNSKEYLKLKGEIISHIEDGIVELEYSNMDHAMEHVETTLYYLRNIKD